MIGRREFIAGLARQRGRSLTGRNSGRSRSSEGSTCGPADRPLRLSRGFAGVWRRSAFQKGRDATVEYHTADGHPERLSAARYAIQAISTNRQFTFTGGLMNYRPVEREVHCLVGSYTGRIFKGEKPTDLPVQQSTRLELINLKTAKAFSLTFPTGLLVRADEVIE